MLWKSRGNDLMGLYMAATSFFLLDLEPAVDSIVNISLYVI